MWNGSRERDSLHKQFITKAYSRTGYWSRTAILNVATSSRSSIDRTATD